ncbi:hypothetical protein POM88_054335 [Heracleum sosnowskyi]|uniref:Uncharacterized protein n=1 Tax=Heracleum sosnowskyi TaxID=360622 RepID=A0AAD8GMY3_9APIA|nr:hypothetical protein POM88_054335 [Heracleum sosnowskyi]
MAPKQTLSQTNFAGIFSPNDAGEGFKGLVFFLNKSYLGSAITSTSILDLDRIEAFWQTVVAQTEGENPSIQFTINGQHYILIAEAINTALGITLQEGRNFAELANDDTLKKLFLKIGYAGPILEEGTTKWYPSGEMDRKHLRKEWSMILDVMVKVFSTKSTGWNGIPSYIKKLTHSLVHGYKVNVGALLMAHLRAAIGKKVSIYPRFLMMCINSFCDFNNDAPRLEACSVLKKNTHTLLSSQNLHAHIPLCFTQHMVDQVSNLDYPLPSGYDSFTLENETELDPNSVNPHSTPYTQPRPSRLPKAQREALKESRKRPLEADVGGSSVSQEGDTAPSAANKEASQTEPPVVPPEPKKKRARRTKTTVIQAAVSQQTVVTERDSYTSLDVPSQQGASIEIGLSPKAPCTESAQTHGSQHEEPPLEETHSELGTPPLSATLSPSSFPTHSFVSSPQPREWDSPNPSGFDHPSPIMDEPHLVVHKNPFLKVKWTPLLQTLSKGKVEDAVTASVAVKDIGNVAVMDTAAVMGGEKDTVNTGPTVTPLPKDAVMPEPVVHTPTDSNIPAKDVVQSSQPDFDAVLLEDDSDDDLPLAKLLKVHSKSSPLMHVSTAHTLSFPSPPRRLRNGGPSALFGNRIEALEGQCATLNSKMDSLSQLVVDGFTATQLSIQFLTDLVAANSTKGEKVARSESISIQGSGGTQGEPAAVKTKGGAQLVLGVKSNAMTKGEQVKPSSGQPKDKAEELIKVDLDGERVLMSKATQDALQRRPYCHKIYL